MVERKRLIPQIEWKRIPEEGIKSANVALNQHKPARNLWADPTKMHEHYVYATHEEIAQALGVTTDEPELGPLADLLFFNYKKDAFASIIPPALNGDFLSAGSGGNGLVILVRDDILRLNRPAPKLKILTPEESNAALEAPATTLG